MLTHKRSILFLTGTRADFGKLEPLARAAVDDGHQVTFFVTGMHMLPSYGTTKVEVHRMQGVKVIEFLNQRDGDPLDIIFAKTLQCLSDYLKIEKPDLVVVHGDRVESMAASFVCSTNYIRCAHVEGGEVSGTIDEVFRHCNTKLATAHLVSSESAKARILAMGEPESRVFVIGSPELDTHSQPASVTFEEVSTRYDISFSEYGIVIFHPVTSELDTIREQAQAIFDIMNNSGKSFVVIKPNNDPGTDLIQDVISKLDTSRFRVIPSMRFAHFSRLLRNASAIIGNSSTGVREAPFLGIPSLDIGTRQTNRSLGSSVTHSSAFDTSTIESFFLNQWGVKYQSSTCFGVGSSASNFSRLLGTYSFWNLPLQKSFVDHPLKASLEINT